MQVRPINDQVVVKCVEPKDRTSGGILLPNVSRARPTEATVLAVGPGRLLDSGKRNKISVKPGDDVLISFSGQALESGEDMVRIINVQDVLAIRE
jgi:chaperonin GroES